MAYTAEQLAVMLTEVQAAISKCLTAQEYNTGAGMGLKRPNLEQLQKREQWILDKQAELTASTSGGGVTLARCVRPS